MIRTVGLIVAAALIGLPAFAQEASLPGGATALNEMHGSWTVTCSVAEGAKQCSFAQALANGQTGQTVVAMDLGTSSDARVEGMLLTAFGLRLADGIKLAIDGNAVGETLPFYMCVETGCLVQLQFDEVALSALRVGKDLQVTGTNGQTGEPVTVPLSLAGFTAAHARTIELQR